MEFNSISKADWEVIQWWAAASLSKNETTMDNIAQAIGVVKKLKPRPFDKITAIKPYIEPPSIFEVFKKKACKKEPYPALLNTGCVPQNEFIMGLER